MKKSELKEAIKNGITSVLLEGMSDKERENRIQHLMRTGAKEKPLRKLAAMGKEDDMHDDPGDIRIDHDYYTENLKEDDEMSDDDKDKAASKEAKKKDSVASISNKLQKLIAKMIEKAKAFKEAEGEAKDKLKDELKDMTVEKKKLEKSL